MRPYFASLGCLQRCGPVLVVVLAAFLRMHPAMNALFAESAAEL